MREDTFWHESYGDLKLHWVLIVVFGVLFITVSPIFYFMWWNDEQVYLSMTCPEIEYAIKNTEIDSQLMWHYRDRCL